MKTLTEYNAERRAWWEDFPKGVRVQKSAGVACPKCHTEVLCDGWVMSSWPPEQQVECPACGYQGSMVL